MEGDAPFGRAPSALGGEPPGPEVEEGMPLKRVQPAAQLLIRPFRDADGTRVVGARREFAGAHRYASRFLAGSAEPPARIQSSTASGLNR